MRSLIAGLVLSLSLVACKPPITELQIPTISSMQGKGYQEVVPTTELKIDAGTDEVTAYLITPEMAMINTEEQLRAKNETGDLELYRKKTMGDDTVICQVRLRTVSAANADPIKWTYALADDTGKTAKGKPVGQIAPPKPAGGSASASFYQDGQIRFEGYKIGTAKKITIKFSREGGKPVTLNWLLPTDHQIPASQPASAPTK